MSAMDALAVLAEEGRLHANDITGEAASSLRSGGFRIEESVPVYIGTGNSESFA